MGPILVLGRGWGCPKNVFQVQFQSQIWGPLCEPSLPCVVFIGGLICMSFHGPQNSPTKLADKIVSFWFHFAPLWHPVLVMCCPCRNHFCGSCPIPTPRSAPKTWLWTVLDDSRAVLEVPCGKFLVPSWAMIWFHLTPNCPNMPAEAPGAFLGPF